MSKTLHFPDAVPALFGDTVYLRELTEDDVPAWFRHASDPESAVLAGDPIPESIGMGVHWLQRHRERLRHHAGIQWAIVPKGSTNSVGLIGLTVTSKAERRAALGAVDLFCTRRGRSPRLVQKGSWMLQALQTSQISAACVR